MKQATLDPVVEAAIVPKRDDQALAVPEPSIAMFERLATDPNVDPDKLERLIAMQERILAHQAKAAFDAAFAEMQGELPVIDEKGRIVVSDVIRSRYAFYEDIIQIIRPILQRHGFSIRHRNHTRDGKQVIVGILTHRAGHSETDEFECPPDNSGGKSGIQAMASTRSYGQRYTTIALVNIVTRGTDDDGQSASQKEAPDPPKGYENWLDDMKGCADDGMGPLGQAWNKSKKEYRDFINAHHKQAWFDMKKTADAADNRRKEQA